MLRNKQQSNYAEEKCLTQLKVRLSLERLCCWIVLPIAISDALSDRKKKLGVRFNA